MTSSRSWIYRPSASERGDEEPDVSVEVEEDLVGGEERGSVAFDDVEVEEDAVVDVDSMPGSEVQERKSLDLHLLVLSLDEDV